MPVPNPQDYFLRLFSQAMLYLQMLLIDGLFSLLTRISLIGETRLDQTIQAPAVLALYSSVQAVAAAVLGCLALAGCWSVMVRHTGLGGLSPQQLLGRLIAVGAAVVSAPEWIAGTIRLNNALCALVGADRLTGVAPGPRTLGLLLGLSPQQQLTFEQALPTVGGAISRALQAALFDDSGPTTTMLASLLLLVLAIVLVLLVLQLLLRLVFLNLLIVIAPLMLVLGVLPATAGWTGLWLRWFFPAVFLQPLQLLILALGHEWLRTSYGGPSQTPATMVLPLLMSLSALWLTLKAPALLAVGYQSATHAVSSTQQTVTSGLGAAAGLTRLVQRLRP